MRRKRIPREGTGDAAASVLETEANFHYGFYYTFKNDKDLRKMFGPGWRKMKYATTAEERKRLAKTTFKYFGVEFTSRKETMRVAEIFSERHGQGVYGPADADRLKAELSAIVEEIRARK